MFGQVFAVDRLEESESPRLGRTGEVFSGVKIQNARLSWAHLRALVDGGKPSARPVLARKLRQPVRIRHGDVGGKVAGFRPERIAKPASQRRTAASERAGVQGIKRLKMVIHAGLHR